jgi:hypothetical protein
LDGQRARRWAVRSKLQYSQTQQSCRRKQEVQSKNGDTRQHVRNKGIEDHGNSSECSYPGVFCGAGRPNRRQARNGANDPRADRLNVCGYVPKGNSRD